MARNARASSCEHAAVHLIRSYIECLAIAGNLTDSTVIDMATAVRDLDFISAGLSLSLSLGRSLLAALTVLTVVGVASCAWLHTCTYSMRFQYSEGLAAESGLGAATEGDAELLDVLVQIQRLLVTENFFEGSAATATAPMAAANSA